MLATAQVAQQAYHSNNVFLWNSLVQRMNVLKSDEANLIAKEEGIDAQQFEIIGEAKTTLQHELDLQVNRERMTGTADRLYQKYKSAGRHPPCNEFVRDFIKELGYVSLSESGLLNGQVTNQVGAMGKDKTDWKQLILKRDRRGLAAAFEEAQANANQGKLVIVAWVNPNKTSTNTGHIAVVMPGVLSGGWDMQVPYIAQAGHKVGTMSLSEGFGPETKEGMVIFVLRSPTLSQRFVKP